MADPVLIQVSPAPGPAVIIPRFLQQPSQRSPDEPLHPDRHRREHRPAGGRPAFRGQGTGALHRPAQQDLDELVQISRLWISGDLPAVEKAVEQVSNPFLRTGVQLVIDNTPEEDILEVLQWRIARLRARENAEAQLFRAMASYAPAFGMIGTLVGLINLMFMLGSGDMDLIGRSLAVALMTTFYGVLLANLILKPVAVKLERRTEQRVALMNLVMQGISMMCNRRSPAYMRETLKSFIAHHDDEIRDGTPAAPRVRPQED